MNTDRILGLRALWKEAFGDSDAFLDSFFSTAFSPEGYHCLTDTGVPASALYWLPCTLDGRPMAYVYAVATKESHRGRGLCRQLMEETHEILKRQGYQGVILVPAKRELFSLYGKLGYRTCCACREFTCHAGDNAVPLQALDAGEYARLRRQALPEGGVIQEGATLRFLQEQLSFYTADGCLLAAAVENGVFVCKELLGNPAAAAGILRALGHKQGSFRVPGPGRDFAMFLPLSEDCPVPRWFGLALD